MQAPRYFQYVAAGGIVCSIAETVKKPAAAAGSRQPEKYMPELPAGFITLPGKKKRRPRPAFLFAEKLLLRQEHGPYLIQIHPAANGHVSINNIIKGEYIWNSSAGFFDCNLGSAHRISNKRTGFG